jgi:hypothetical protein
MSSERDSLIALRDHHADIVSAIDLVLGVLDEAPETTRGGEVAIAAAKAEATSKANAHHNGESESAKVGRMRTQAICDRVTNHLNTIGQEFTSRDIHALLNGKLGYDMEYRQVQSIVQGLRYRGVIETTSKQRPVEGARRPLTIYRKVVAS